MTTEDLMKLADTYARCNANYHVENLYGTSGSYTEDCARQQQQARQALLDALEALGREVAELKAYNQTRTDELAASVAQCAALRAELAAIRAVPVSDVNAGLVEALSNALYSLQVPNVSCQAGVVKQCMCRKCVVEHCDAALSTARTQQAPKGGE